MTGGGFFSRQVLFMSLLINIALLAYISHHFTTTGQPTAYIVPEEYQTPVLVNRPDHDAALAAAPAGMTPLVPPPTRCGMCDVAPELCAEIGKEKMDRAVSYFGSNKRLRRVLRKMRTGEPWVMGVIGGSVSKGHGILWGGEGHDLPIDPKYRNPNMHRVIFDHLDSRFPANCPTVQQALDLAEKEMTPELRANNVSLTDVAAFEGTLEQDYAEINRPISRAYGFSAREKGVNSMINGAQGASGSSYFAYCFGEHIPEDVDLIIVEQAINDERHVWTLDTYESMVRALLDLPNSPAIITIETYALMFQQMAMGGDMHKGLNEYYDIPGISVRNPFIEETFANLSMVAKHFKLEKEREEQTLDDYDTRHISKYLHEKAGQLVNAYIDAQICSMKAEDGDSLDPDVDGDRKLFKDEPVDPLPRLRLNSPFDLTTHTPSLRPSCFSTSSVRHKLTPSANDGRWTEWAWKEKKYLIATEPGALVSFPVTVALGTVNIIFQRSAQYGLGSAMCWIEGYKDELSKTLQGYWDLKYNLLQTVAIDHVPPGNHTVTCKLIKATGDPQGGHEFRISSITSI